MKKISTFSLIILLLLAGFLPAWQSAARSEKLAPIVAAPATVLPVETVSVVSASQPTVTVVASQAGAALAACEAAVSGSDNLVQDTGLVNLNQPANCFVLKPAVLPPSPQLSVQPLVRPQVSLVVKTVPTLSFVSLGAGAVPQLPNLPVLPLAGFSLIMVYELFEIKKASKFFASKIVSFVSETGFGKYLVLRC